MPELKSLWIFCLLILTAPLFSQEDFSLSLDKVAFEGLDKTNPNYLTELLGSELNEPIDIREIQDDLQVLKNLASVAQAYYTIDTLGKKINLTYHIEERKTALPIINFGGISDNIWFSLGFKENNLRGRGDQLLAYYQNNDGLHSGQIFFRKPRISNSDWGYSFTLNKWSSQEPVFFDSGTVAYYYNNNGLAASLLRNIGINNLIEVGGTYFHEAYEKTPDQVLEDPPGPESFVINKFLTKLELKQDYLNYHYFYLKGYETSLNYQNVLNIDASSWFNSLQFQGKLFFRPKKKLNLAFRLKMAISSNEDSPFAPFVADSHVNIRGIGNRIDRGTAQLVLNVEARYTLRHKKYWSSQLVAFADNGTWRNPGGAISDILDPDQFRQFVGMGFRINYQRVFGATLRVDYGIDLYDLSQKGIVIGLGQYF